MRRFDDQTFIVLFTFRVISINFKAGTLKQFDNFCHELQLNFRAFFDKK